MELATRTELEARAEGHTPTPYSYHTQPTATGKRDWIEDANGSVVVENLGCHDGPFIVLAANSYAAMKAALEDVQQEYGGSCRDLPPNHVLVGVNAALRLAHGEKP